MAIVKTDDKHYKNIAETLRSHLGTDDKFNPSEMSGKVTEVHNNAYDTGYTKGYTDGSYSNSVATRKTETLVVLDDIKTQKVKITGTTGETVYVSGKNIANPNNVLHRSGTKTTITNDGETVSFYGNGSYAEFVYVWVKNIPDTSLYVYTETTNSSLANRIKLVWLDELPTNAEQWNDKSSTVMNDTPIIVSNSKKYLLIGYQFNNQLKADNPGKLKVVVEPVNVTYEDVAYHGETIILEEGKAEIVVNDTTLIYAENEITVEYNTNPYAQAFNSVICVGDSHTAMGYYPTSLEELSLWDVTNAGESGLSALTWWQRHGKNGISTTYTYDKDAMIVFLGTNYHLSDTLETDVNNYNSYDEYAETTTGAYCKIIEYALEQNPNLKIFLCTLPQVFYPFGTDWYVTEQQDRIRTNSVINQIADKYDLPVIDLWNKLPIDYRHRDIYNTDGSHYTEEGYKILAETIYDGICDIIAENPSKYGVEE